MTKSLSIQHCIDEATRLLVDLHCEPGSDAHPSTEARTLAQLDARVLLGFVLGCSQSFLYANNEQTLNSNQHSEYGALVERRAQGEPIAYLTGTQEFWSLAFNVTPAVLVPRADTELLVEQSLELLSDLPHPDILELGTGSGAIAVAIASERPDASILATDIAEDALQVAMNNANTLLGEQAKQIKFVQSDWFEQVAVRPDLQNGFHLIISNPPYLAENDPHLSRAETGIGFEPRQALVSGDGGLAAIKGLVEQAISRLHAEGWLLLEHGYDQAQAVRECFNAANYRTVESLRDLAGVERVTIGRRPGPNV